jgi:acetyltransferase-like isoleucine patch superfamily enzyme
LQWVIAMKKKRFWYPLANIKNRFLFAEYGRDVYIGPGVIINRPRFISLGDRVRILRNTSINLHPRDRHSQEILLELGNDVIISENCYISACNSIIIEENVGISPNVMIIDNSRKPGDVSRPSKEQDISKDGYVKIGADSWIAFGSCVLPNVTIGRHCIIGALSVVNTDIPPYSVAVGSPARVVKRYDFEGKQWVKASDEGRTRRKGRDTPYERL